MVNLVAYLSDLLRRASAGLGRGVETIVQAVVAELPQPEDEALGA